MQARRTDDKLVLVCGATGQQGGAVARHLLRAGHHVRVLIHGPEKASGLEAMGAQIVRGDLLERRTLDTALEGVRKVFLVTTRKNGGLEAEVRQGVNMADAALAAGVEHLVYSSVGCAGHHTGVPHFDTKYEVEQHILRLGLPFTFLRPAFFMENFVSSMFGPALERGRLELPLPPSRPIQMVAVDDIGRFAAAAFQRPMCFKGQAIGLAGSKLSFAQALRLLSAATGRALVYEQLPDDSAEGVLGRDWALMFRWFDKVGYDADLQALESRWQVPVTTFHRWIRQSFYPVSEFGGR